MKTTGTYDAVAESRRWKEAVARQTGGMTRGQIPAFFSKTRALATLAEMRHSSGQASVLRARVLACVPLTPYETAL